jgi:hypothetical protein
MSKNKQSSIDWFLDELIKEGYIKRLPVTQLQQAKAMHKQEIENSYDYMRCIGNFTNGKEYYNETFGGNDEQAMIDYNKMEEEWEMDNYNKMKDEQQ